MLRLADCMPHAAFCFFPCLSHVHIACCVLQAACHLLCTARCVLWAVCRNIAPYSVIFSNVRSKSGAVYSLASTACCLLFAACCFLPAACRLRKIAVAADTVDICALLSYACCAAVAAVLGSCHPQTGLSGKIATYLVNILTRG